MVDDHRTVTSQSGHRRVTPWCREAIRQVVFDPWLPFERVRAVR